MAQFLFVSPFLHLDLQRRQFACVFHTKKILAPSDLNVGLHLIKKIAFADSDGHAKELSPGCQICKLCKLHCLFSILAVVRESQ